MKRKVSFSDLEGQGKLPPQELDLEEAVLGALILEPDSYTSIEEIIHEKSFYKDNHGLIFKAISDMVKAKEKVDILTVTAHLKKKGELDSVGGAFYITQLTNRVVTSANVEVHSRYIAEAYLAREIIRISGEYNSRAYTNQEDVFDMIEEMHKEIDDIKNFGIDSNSDVPFQISVKERIKQKEEMRAKGVTLTGISTGDSRLDNIISGFNKGGLYVFAGAPAMGKSVKGMNYAEKAAKQGYTVPFFSLEMPKDDLIDRLIVEECKIPLHDYRANRMSDLDIQKMKAAGDALIKLPIIIYDEPSASPNFIRRKLKQLVKRGVNLGMAVIDYAQLLKGDGKFGTREQEVSSVVKELKVIAKEFNIPIILLAQVGRGIYQTPDRRPDLNHLRETSEIQNSADFVAFIYRPSYYFDHQDHPDYKGNETSKIYNMDKPSYDLASELIIAKNRGGIPNAVLYENFYGQYSCFTKDPISYNSDVFLEDSAPNSDLVPF
jgi:replicative DNA helicase